MKLEERKFIIYMHIFPDGRKYIGMTALDLQKRWGKGEKYNKQFRRATAQYGWENVRHEVLASNLSMAEALQLETKLIAEYDTTNPDKGLNSSKGGWYTAYGREMTEAEKEAMSAHFRSPVVQFSLGGKFLRTFKSSLEACKVVGMSPAVLSECLMGTQHTAGGYQWRKLEEWDGQLCSDISDRYKIVQFTKDGEFIREWDSLTTIQQETSMNLYGISNCCDFVSKSSQGYIWRRKTDWDGKPLAPYTKRPTIPIIQYTISGEFVREWPSISELCRTGYSEPRILKCLHGRYDSVDGYVWRYKGT